MSAVMCRLIPFAPYTITNALTLVNWGVDGDATSSFNRGFTIANGSTDVHVPQSGIYQISCGLSTQANIAEAALFRLLVRVGEADRIATGARARAANLFQGPQASTLIPIEVGQPVQVRGGVNGGANIELSPNSSYLCLELRAPL